MTWQRRVLVVLWLLLAGWPFAVLVVDLVRHPSAWSAWLDGSRLLVLAKNTCLLVLGVWLTAMPIGVAAALLLYRSDLPFRKFLRRVVIVALFVPLPVLASAWQATLGSGGWLTLPGWRTVDANDPDLAPTGIAWKPWAHGLPAAIWVHACAALPWVIWLAGIGLSHVERPLEEDAIMSGGVWRSLWTATLPRAAPALLACAAWVGLLAANEVTVTDMMQVPTLAEEVYVQFSRPDTGDQDRDVLARAMAVATPVSLLLAGLVAFYWRRWERRLPPLALPPEEFVLIRFGPLRWVVLAAAVALLLVIMGVPLVSLVWRSGHVPPGDEWSVVRTATSIRHAWSGQRALMARSVASAFAVGVLVALFAAWASWLARERLWLRRWLFGMALFCACLPGPVLGIALKESINFLVEVEAKLTGGNHGPIYRWLYSGPSSLPVDWAAALRLLPCAFALTWPVIRTAPRELFEQVRLDGATAWQEWRLVAWPSVSRAVGLAAIAVAALALGELSAGKLVETPGGQTFAHEVFQQMHYGVDNNLAAMCLLLVGAVAAALIGGWIVQIVWRLKTKLN